MSAQIGIYGLGVMGANLARNFASRGSKVALFNIDLTITQSFIKKFGNEGNFVASADVESFIQSLQSPRIIMMMLPAGKVVDEVIEQISPLLDKGDILIDGGNSHFADTHRREEELKKSGIAFIGIGISGGEEGALTGPSIMIGGDRNAYPFIGPIFATIAAKVDENDCAGWVGSNGAGHFVKMVHNGIEYADMQFIAEAYDLLTKVEGLNPTEVANLFERCNQGLLSSYLMDVAIEVLRHVDPKTEKPFLEIVRDRAAQKGTGRWTIETGLELASPVTTISASVNARMLSYDESIRSSISKHLNPVGVKKTEISDLIEEALWVAKLIAYSEGMSLITKSNSRFNWGIEPQTVISLWQGGCIIRASILKDIKTVFSLDSNVESLLAAPHFTTNLQRRQESLRSLVSIAVQNGVPTMALSAALNYLDFMQQPNASTSMIQGMRDYFGAHTYERQDQEGVFHTLWSGNRSEVEIEKNK
jgi:6-phosphogluconate dehydrogenase